MSSGGHSRSGPAKSPHSRRSERDGYSLQRLPRTGYSGRPPGLNQYLPKPTARHRQVWTELWRTPQAWAWSQERWRWPIVADLTRRVVQADDLATPVSIAGIVRQLRDDLGLSAAGLRQQGWAIEAENPDSPSAYVNRRKQGERRLRSVPLTDATPTQGA